MDPIVIAIFALSGINISIVVGYFTYAATKKD